MLVALALAAVSLLGAQQPATSQKQGAAGDAAAAGTTNAEFAAAADEVLHQMSEITGLKLLTPLKKSLRSREQIRAYVINEMKEDKDEAERYAGAAQRGGVRAAAEGIRSRQFHDRSADRADCRALRSQDA